MGKDPGGGMMAGSNHRSHLPRRRTVLCLALLLMIAGVGRAQQSLGGKAGSPYRIGFGARSIGMAQSLNAFRSTDGISSLNPSLLPFIQRPSVEVGVLSLPLDRTLYSAAYSTNLPPSAGLAFTFAGARVSDIQGRDRNGVPTEMYATAEYSVGLLFGLRPSPRFTIGAGAKLLYAKLLPELSQSTVGLDFGAAYLVSDRMTLSAVFRDVNAKYRWDTGSLYGRTGNTTLDAFPTRTILAISYAIPTADAVVNAEAERIAGRWLLRGGVEYSPYETIHLRAGVDALDPQERVGSRAGFGITVDAPQIMWAPSFDYAFLVEPYAPAGSHALSVRFRI